MSHGIVKSSVWIVMLLVVPMSHAETLTDALPLARRALEARLAREWPGVTDWAIDPLPTRGRFASSAVDQVLETDVVKLGARSAVRFTWNVDGKTFVHTTWFAVRGMQRVMTVRSDLKAGDALGGLEYELADHDVVGASCTPVTAKEALVGLRTTRSLKAGEAICQERVEPRPLVARGDEVTVRSIAGPVTIIAKGIAQQDGRLGQVLRIKNPQSRELYLAAVAGDREVMVHE